MTVIATGFDQAPSEAVAPAEEMAAARTGLASRPEDAAAVPRCPQQHAALRVRAQRNGSAESAAAGPAPRRPTPAPSPTSRADDGLRDAGLHPQNQASSSMRNTPS
ncbi:MAG: hypothetical protein MZU95_04905 [Desulfomicrobium escambiense]|nr:hypothetical protein [Desulfomicrobium escambiense]